MHYASSPFDHARPDATGVLLLNLGTPSAPTTAAVRRYLAEFLSDPRVVEAPRWLWWLALHGVILRIRPPRSARAYREVWSEAGSPLAVHTAALGEALAGRLRAMAPSARVAVGMRYGEPSVARALDALRAGGNLRRLLVLPLYPQYSGSTTGSAFDAVSRALGRWRYVPELRQVADYADDIGWIEAIARSIAEHRSSSGSSDRLLFSFHGIPRRYVLGGDPYYCQCLASARRVAARLDLRPEDWSVSFQSRVGRERWLEPDTEAVLSALPREGTRSVQVVCPGFAVDCLETLEEIAIRGRVTFLAAGGERFDYVPALNASAAHVDALAGLVARHAAGWPDFGSTPGEASEAVGPATRDARHRDRRVEFDA